MNVAAATSPAADAKQHHSSVNTTLTEGFKYSKRILALFRRFFRLWRVRNREIGPKSRAGPLQSSRKERKFSIERLHAGETDSPRSQGSIWRRAACARPALLPLFASASKAVMRLVRDLSSFSHLADRPREVLFAPEDGHFFIAGGDCSGHPGRPAFQHDLAGIGTQSVEARTVDRCESFEPV
jgi:hypothetical protein